MQTLNFRTLYFGQKSEFRTINVCTKINISDRLGQNFGGNNLIFPRNTISPRTKIFENYYLYQKFHFTFVVFLGIITFDQI